MLLERQKQGLGGVIFKIQHDSNRSAPLAADANQAHGRAQGVQIGHAVSHEEDLAGLGDELGEGRGDDPRLDLGAPLGLLGAAAKEVEVIFILDDSLVAAAAQRHFDGEVGEAVVLLEGRAVLADADRQRSRHARGVGDGADVVENGELSLLEPGRSLASKMRR